MGVEGQRGGPRPEGLELLLLPLLLLRVVSEEARNSSSSGGSGGRQRERRSRRRRRRGVVILAPHTQQRPHVELHPGRDLRLVGQELQGVQDRGAVVELEHELLRVRAVPVCVKFFFSFFDECCFVFPFFSFQKNNLFSVSLSPFLSLSFTPSAPPRALPAATARPSIDQVGRRVVWVLFLSVKRERKRVSLCIATSDGFFRPSSGSSTPSFVAHRPCQLRPSRRDFSFPFVTSPVVAIAVNESLRAADMALKMHTHSGGLAGGRGKVYFECEQSSFCFFRFLDLFASLFSFSLSLIFLFFVKWSCGLHSQLRGWQPKKKVDGGVGQEAFFSFVIKIRGG